MAITIVKSPQAERLMRDETFSSSWARLYRACPWATAFQSPLFAKSWYGSYRAKYEPILACQFGPGDDLQALLPLAVNKVSGHPVLPGAQQAEYKSWLALPEYGESFPEQAFTALAAQTDIHSFSFRYLAPGTPMPRVDEGRRNGAIYDCEIHRRPFIPLESSAFVQEYVRKNSNSTIRNSRNRLQKMGGVRLEQISDANDFVAIFDLLIQWYETRQGAKYGKTAFEDDSQKKPWHVELLKENLLHVSVLKIGSEIISAAFGISDGKHYALAMSMFSPAHARYSPMAIHLLLLVEKLHAEGYSTLDLTPGPDPFKERFAAEFDSVNVFSIYLSRTDWILAKVRGQTLAFARGTLSALGVAPASLNQKVQRVRSMLHL